MYLKNLKSSQFSGLLYKIDKDLAAEAKHKPCPHCCGQLDVANYPRKPRGGLSDGNYFDVKFGLCCRNEGCRRRLTPKSIRFMGRFTYISPSFILICFFTGRRPQQARRLERLFGVSQRTLKRWLSWWEESFPISRFWKEYSGQLSGIESCCLQNIFLHLQGLKESAVEGFIQVLRFFTPLDHQNI